MLHNNIEIKRCVFQYMQEENKRPKSFSVTFMLEPVGRARRVRIPQAIYAGTSFETCINSVISDLQFPSFGGPPTSKTVQFNME